MLFIIDMQNSYIDKDKGERYIKDSEKMVDGIIDKIKKTEEKGEYIFHTVDIPIEKNNFKGENSEQNLINDIESIEIQEMKSDKEEKWSCEPYKLLKSYLDKHEKVKKSYYAIPPETLFEIQRRFKEQNHIIEEIEFVGIETHICVLANAICLQSAFPQANIVIHESLCMSKNEKDHKRALKIMEALGMEIRREKDEIIK
ncbi:isochorismatase family protein [Tissierella sp.]|uniref:isochorismatase family protein n=1 Tax=Tissierella sp. TaxID=41274 RepID=UPI00285C6E8A|nr:isochorismatase family protein [Tissierella sp.]MDR7856638.1 isochorismatase family protein [Tissierella sp.]